MWKCNVLNCGGGKCVHQLTDARCPYCNNPLVRVVTTGFLFCSNHEAICDYELDINRGGEVSEIVKVQITATQRVEYNQEVEMTMEEFKKLDQMLDEANGFAEKSRVAGKIELFLDLKDVCGADDLEIDKFHIVGEEA